MPSTSPPWSSSTAASARPRTPATSGSPRSSRRSASPPSASSEDPEERRGAFRLFDRLQVVADELEARLADEPERHLRLVAAEERLEPVQPPPVPAGRVVGAEVGGRRPALPQPDGDAAENRRVLLARDVIQHVEGDDRVERRRLEVDLRQIGLDEPRVRDALACAANLLRGDVDADEVRALREDPGRAHA